MAQPRTTRSGDTQAAKAQLRVADPQARVGKTSRARSEVATKALITAPLSYTDAEGEVQSHEFSLAEDVGIMPLMEWAAASDVDVASADGLRAVYYVLQDTVHEDEWAEFRKYAREHKIGAEELLDFANSALEALAGRPTEDATGS